jgi:hypothetical protein
MSLFDISGINNIIAEYAEESTALMNNVAERYIEILFPEEKEKRLKREEKEKMAMSEESRKWYHLSRNPVFYGSNNHEINIVLTRLE